MSLLTILYVLLVQSFIFRFFGFFLGRAGIIKIIIFNFFAIIGLLMYKFYFVYNVALIPIVEEINLGTWITIKLFHVSWLFVFDSLSFFMVFMVILISFLVHIYSLNYLELDPFLIRFLSYLSLFTSFMLLLIISNNCLLFFFGWEGVGLSSYLLISFWSTRVQAHKAAFKALLINRIGDFFLLIGFCFCFNYFKSLDFDVIITLAPYFVSLSYVTLFNYELFIIDVIAFCLFIGVVGKSAQLGLHIWLPDAMEGPTPVSALIHAATMVTAGVFLLLRLSYFFILSKSVLTIIIILGAVTTISSALIGLVQFDLKKIIAYSTCSQLGYMVFTAGTSNFILSFYHLLNHAFFKALLFLTAGSVIHALLGEQDTRKMGGLLKILPFQYFSFLIGSLSLIGFFFFSGFYSKDNLLNNFNLLSSDYYFLFSYWLSLTTTLLTSIYSFRLIYDVFMGDFKGFRNSWKHLSSSLNVYMKSVLLSLICLSIISGYLLQNYFLKNSLFFTFTLAYDFNLIDGEFIPIYIKLLPSFFSLIGLVLIFYFNKFYYKLILFSFLLYRFCYEKLFIDNIYNYLGRWILFQSTYLFFTLDKGILELYGPYWLYADLKYISININLLNPESLFLNLFILLFNLTAVLIISFIIIF